MYSRVRREPHGRSPQIPEIKVRSEIHGSYAGGLRALRDREPSSRSGEPMSGRPLARSICPRTHHGSSKTCA